MPQQSRDRERVGYDDQRFTEPRPEAPAADHPDDLRWEEVMNYAARAALWLMEQCMNKTAKTPEEAAARKIETQNIAALQRTIERMVRIRKQQAAENATKKSDDDLDRELLEAIAKVSDAARA